MADKYERLAQTIIKAWQGLVTEAELVELREWLAASPENNKWLGQFLNEEWLAAEISCYHNSNREENWQQVSKQIELQELQQDIVPMQEAAVRISKAKRAWQFFYKYKWPVAAAIGLGIIAKILWLSPTRQQTAADVVKGDSIQKVYNDTSRIVFQSADGSKYDMKLVGDSLLTEQGDFALYRKDQKLVIKRLPQSKRKQATGYNKLTIPEGGRYEIVLPDSSHVWLNAASSIAIPAVDTGIFRRVIITGEAYFEVKHNSKRAFLVQLPDTTLTLEVTGTIFNVTAYAGETFKTTLVEGSLSVKKGSHKKLIKPGQQAQVSNNDIQVIDVDTDQVIAWKNGMFEFEDDNLIYTVREIARWYNLEPYYIDTPMVNVSYSDSRDLPVDSTLQRMRAGNVRINLQREGRRLVVRR